MPSVQLPLRCRHLAPVISEILEISGTAGASIGVLHNHEVVYTDHFGHRDVDNEIPANDNTLYYIASLTKFMTAAAIGILVDEGHLKWEDLVSTLLPDFQHRDQKIREQVNLLDILSHRTGLAQKMFAWMGQHSRPQQVTAADFTKTATYLEPVFPLRERFVSNNWLYGIAAQIVERVSGVEFSEFMDKNFFTTLGMSRTSIHKSSDGVDNFAEAYMWNDDSPYRVHKPPIEIGSFMEGAVGVKSSIHDLLIFYGELLKAREDQLHCKTTSTPGSPFKQVQTLFSPQTVLRDLPTAFEETTYSLGWAQVRLPSALGVLSDNVDLVEEMPRIGEGLKSKPTVLYHGGALVGYLSTVMVLPDTNSVIVVLANTLANQDPSDWIAQALLEAVLDVPHPTDFISLAKEAAHTYSALFPTMHDTLARERVPGTCMKDPKEYVGHYENVVGTFVLDVYVHGGDLCLSLNGHRAERHKLKHYHYDTFSFEMSYRECLEREMWLKTRKDFYLLEFCANEKHEFGSVLWRPDWAVPQGEVFVEQGVLPG